MKLKRLLRGDELDFRIAADGVDHVPKELRTFKPPMSEQFSVEAGDDGPGAAGALLKFAKSFAYDAAKMLRVFIQFCEGALRNVREFVRERRGDGRNLVITQSALPVLAMEFQIFGGPAIADDAA